MKIIIVGYGSIGRRHYNLLNERGADLCVVTKQKNLGVLSFSLLEEALSAHAPDVVFICNETVKHTESILECLKYSKHLKIVVEKPLSSTLDDSLLSLCLQDQSRIFVSYNLRLHPLLIQLKEEILNQKILDVVVNVGQDLSTWRNVDHKESYSSHRSRGGGVLRDLSHELDYIQWIFGSVTKSAAHVERCSELTEDSEDLVHALLKTNRCPSVLLRLSYLDKDPIRIIRVNTDKHTYEVNLLKGYLHRDGKDLMNSKFIVETFSAQADKILSLDFNSFCSYQEAIDIMRLILEIENS